MLTRTIEADAVAVSAALLPSQLCTRNGSGMFYPLCSTFSGHYPELVKAKDELDGFEINGKRIELYIKVRQKPPLHQLCSMNFRHLKRKI